MNTYICPLCKVEVLYMDKRVHECKPRTSSCEVVDCTNPVAANDLCKEHLDEMAKEEEMREQMRQDYLDWQSQKDWT